MKLKQIEWIDLGKHNLALLPESGEWLLLDDLSKDIISRLGEFKKISDVEREYPGLEPNEIRRLLNLLEQNKFIDDGSVVDNSCKPCNHGMPTHAVLNLTEACNLKCTYCYVNAGCNQKDFMKPETAFRIADEYSLMNPERKVNLTMHGGEPLLNFDLIKKLAAYTKDRRDQIDITMQTNATLLTDEIAQFIKENKIGVGVSIDGPAEFHNKTRPLQNGKGSFEQVMRGIRILQKHGIPFGTISVMNGQNAEHIDEIIDFFLANDIYSYSFIPLQRIGRGENDEQSYIDGETMFAAYKRIMKRIVDFNTKNKGEKRIEERFVKNLARNVFLHKKQFMCMRAPCGAGRNTMGFGINGDFYACDDFINDPDFRIGTLDGGHFKDQILKSKVVAQTEFRAMKHLSRCKDCEWRGVCGGEPWQVLLVFTCTMKNHTVEGGKILKKIVEDAQGAFDADYLNESIEMACYHHEKWDGSGYPYRLKGEEIPLSARIMAVADVFDALIAERIYKKGFSYEKAMAIITGGAGTHFDPEIVDTFTHISKNLYDARTRVYQENAENAEKAGEKSAGEKSAGENSVKA